eukprot:2714934-Amphidinium_carterae.1
MSEVFSPVQDSETEDLPTCFALLLPIATDGNSADLHAVMTSLWQRLAFGMSRPVGIGNQKFAPQNRHLMEDLPPPLPNPKVPQKTN